MYLCIIFASTIAISKHRASNIRHRRNMSLVRRDCSINVPPAALDTKKKTLYASVHMQVPVLITTIKFNIRIVLRKDVNQPCFFQPQVFVSFICYSHVRLYTFLRTGFENYRSMLLCFTKNF